MIRVLVADDQALVRGTIGLLVDTAKTHVGRLLAKLGVRDRAQLVMVAYETGLVPWRLPGEMVVLRDRSMVLIRQVRAADAPLLADGFARLSAESRATRCLGAKKELSPAELRTSPTLTTTTTRRSARWITPAGRAWASPATSGSRATRRRPRSRSPSSMAPGQGYLAFVRVDHRRPPLDRDPRIGDDRPSHAHDDLVLRSSSSPPVLADGLGAGEGLPEYARPVPGVRREQIGDLVLIGRLPGPPIALYPMLVSHGLLHGLKFVIRPP